MEYVCRCSGDAMSQGHRIPRQGSSAMGVQMEEWYLWPGAFIPAEDYGVCPALSSQTRSPSSVCPRSKPTQLDLQILRLLWQSMGLPWAEAIAGQQATTLPDWSCKGKDAVLAHEPVPHFSQYSETGGSSST